MADRPHPLLLAAIAAQNSPYKVRGNIPLELKPDGGTNEVFLVRGSVPLELRPDGSNIIGPFPVRGEIPISLNPQGIAGSTPINVSGSVPIPSIAPRGRVLDNSEIIGPSGNAISFPAGVTPVRYYTAREGITLDGTNEVQQIDDQSGNNAHMTFAATARPIITSIDGGDVVFMSHDGGNTNPGIFTAPAASTSWTIIMGYRHTGSGWCYIYDNNTLVAKLESNLIGWQRGGTVNSSNLGSTIFQQLNIYEWVVDNANVQLFRNGNLIGSGTVTPTSTTIDRLRGIGFVRLTGQWSDFILINSAISESDRAAIRSAIQTEYPTRSW